MRWISLVLKYFRAELTTGYMMTKQRRF